MLKGDKFVKEMTNSIYTQIEDLRRRAKDNKSKNGQFYLNLSFETLKDLRTLLFTIIIAVFAYFQSGQGIIKNECLFKGLFLTSVSFGLLSYIFTWMSNIRMANYYSEKERVFSVAFSDQEHAHSMYQKYEDMIKTENEITASFKNHWYPLSLIFMLLQIVFLVLFLFFL